MIEVGTKLVFASHPFIPPHYAIVHGRDEEKWIGRAYFTGQGIRSNYGSGFVFCKGQSCSWGPGDQRIKDHYTIELP